MFNNLGSSATSQPISVWGTNTRWGPISDGNGNALREIAYRAPFGDKYKFQESRICHEKWLPSSQEYIPQRSTNMKIHPLIMTTPLREVYKSRQIVRGRGLAIFGGEINKRKERKHQGVSSALLSLSLLGKHTHIITKYKLGLKHLLLGRWVGFKRFSHCRKSHTHKLGA